MTLTVHRLFIYPIKSLQPIEVDAVELTDHGIRFDRSFALIYEPKNDTHSNDAPSVVRHLTIKKVFRLALFRPQVDKTWSHLTIKYFGCNPPATLTIPLVPSPLTDSQAETYLLSIFGTAARGIDVGQESADFFSQHLQCGVRLVFIGGLGYREIPGAAYVTNLQKQSSPSLEERKISQRIRFADAAPLLITSTASEHNCRQRLQEADRNEDVIIRFRTNIHIDVGNLAHYDEDKWQTLVRPGSASSDEVMLRCISQCVRCLSINADMGTGGMVRRERQLYGLLAPDRRVNERFPHKPVFGQYALGSPSGAILRVGDEVFVVERSP